jgi:hypothetical protein
VIDQFQFRCGRLEVGITRGSRPLFKQPPRSRSSFVRGRVSCPQRALSRGRGGPHSASTAIDHGVVSVVAAANGRSPGNP